MVLQNELIREEESKGKLKQMNRLFDEQYQSNFELSLLSYSPVSSFHDITVIEHTGEIALALPLKTEKLSMKMKINIRKIKCTFLCFEAISLTRQANTISVK